MSRQHELLERELDVLQILTTMNGIMSEFVAAVRGMQVNGLLFSGAGTIPASGVYETSFVVPYAYVHLVNLGTATTMTVTNTGIESSAPTQGVGVKKIPAGAAFGFNLVGRQLVVYGNAGDTFNLEVHVKPERAGT